MKRVQVLALLVGVVMCAVPVLAQQAAPLALTLDEAIARATAAAPRLAEARAYEAAADASVAVSRASSRPTVSALAGVLRTNPVTEFGVPQPDGTFNTIFHDVPTNYRFRGEMLVPLYTSGRSDALLASAEADRQAAEAGVRTTTADVALETAAAYWALVSAREAVAVRERALARADAGVSEVRARVDAGVLPPNDLLSSQAQRARQNVQLIQARNAAALAEIRLARAIGVPVDQHIDATSAVDQPVATATALAALDVQAIVARAGERRAERAALTGRQQSLEQSALAAARALRPQIQGVVAVEPSRPNARFVPRTDEWHNSWDLGVNVTWAIFDGGRAKGQRAANLAQANALQHRLADFDAQLAVDVRERLLDLESTRAALVAAAEGIDAATEARRVVSERFAVGVATNTEVLDADVALLEAELERTSLLAALRLGEARLIRTAGAN